MQVKTTNQISISCLALLFLIGCGGAGDRPDLGYVEGTVTLDGQPLEGAYVSFKPGDGQPSFDRTDSSGKYELLYIRDIKGAKIGEHRVQISTATEEEPEEKVPEQYNRKSELRREVLAGDNQFDFDLKTSS